MNSDNENSVPQSGVWRYAGISIAALMLLTFLLYQQTVIYLIKLWSQVGVGNYAHGYLVLMISVYLVYYNRKRLMLLTPHPEYRAVVAVALTVTLWMIAVLVDVEMLQTVGLLLMLLSLTWLMLGTPVTKVLAFPILFISFGIPIWFPLSPLLQELTADIVFAAIRALSVPALRIENMIALPAGNLFIDEGCGGLNYFLAALTLATIYAYLNYQDLRSRLTVVLITVLAAVFVNILRVFVVVYLGYSTDMEHSLIEDHLGFGWTLFGVLILVLLAIDVKLHNLRQKKSVQHIAENRTSVLAPATRDKYSAQFVVATLVAATLVSAGPAFMSWSNSQTELNSDTELVLPVINIDGWHITDTGYDNWKPDYRGAITQQLTYENSQAEQIYLYLGLYISQRQGEELINDLNRISDEKSWQSQYQRAQEQENNGRQVYEQLLVHNDGTQRLVWYWYHVAERDTINKYHAKALQVLGLIKGVRQAGVIAIAANLETDPETTRKKLERFSRDLAPQVNRWIDDID